MSRNSNVFDSILGETAKMYNIISPYYRRLMLNLTFQLLQDDNKHFCAKKTVGFSILYITAL